MILLPAVDIQDGRAVRLRQGDFDDETVYAADPVDAARAWAEAGANGLHVVDLDGARSGEPASLEHLRRIVAAVDVPVQYGGGLRTTDAVAEALAAGAMRVVAGTAALSSREFLQESVRRFGRRFWVAVDARNGAAAVAGWTESTGARAEAVVGRLAASGVAGVVYTDVDRDGMLVGPDLEAVERVTTEAGGGTQVIYSGGVGTVEDLRALAGVEPPGLWGVICGKALYERRFTVAEGNAALARG